MGKPSAPPPPDYAAAAQQQGVANVNSAVASNRLNQVNQQGPYGSLTYSYDSQNNPAGGYVDSQTGQWIPQVSATTTLAPAQQKLLDQNNQISQNLNDVAIKGIGYVGDTASKPIDTSGLPSFATGLAQPTYDTSAPDPSQFKAQRDEITNAMMQRLQPYIDQQQSQLDTKLANQGIQHGSQASNYDYDTFNRGVNDQRIAALLAGDQEQQNQFQNALASTAASNQAREAQFQAGLASGQFSNQARAQALQEQDYLRNQPLNMLNALRTGNQVTTPTFGNVSGGAQVGAAPIYQATADQYNAQMQAYQAKMAAYGGLLGGLGDLGGAGIMKFVK